MPTLRVGKGFRGRVELDPRTGPMPGFPMGRPSRVDGQPTYESSDTSIVKIKIDDSAPTMAFWVRGIDIGACTVTVTGDADLGTGVRPVIGVLDVEVIEDEAANLNLNVGPTEVDPDVD